jgi:succinate dehydrogenase / fumarate reductase iron-sulfur subunit
MKLTLHIWRQPGRNAAGRFETYQPEDLNEHMSLLEMLDVVNEGLTAEGREPIAFEHDCREGICGCCSLVINGRPHGKEPNTATCQLHLRKFKDGEELWIEPFRAKAFPVLRDLVVDRSPLDRIIQAGGYISARAGSAPEANATPVPKPAAEKAMDAAACIGCGACVAACPNASAMLFVSAKVGHLGLLPQGQAERYPRVRRMLEQHEAEGFGNCTNHGACQNACPKGISVEFIARLNRDLVRAVVMGAE